MSAIVDTMDAGTAILVIYLAGMGPAPRDPLQVYFIMFPKMQLAHTRVPLRHPLGVKMRSMEACLQVAARERARGNKAGCEQEHNATAPRDYWPGRPPPA